MLLLVGLLALAAPPAAPKLPTLLSIDWRTLATFPGGAEDNDGATPPQPTHPDPLTRRTLSAGGFFDNDTLVTAFGLSGHSYPGSVNSSYFLELQYPSTGWRPLPPIPIPPRSMEACTMAAGSIWCFGGMDAEYRKQGSANFTLRDGCVLSGRPWRWDTAPSLPYAVSGHGLAAIGAKIYLVGGQFHEG